MTVRHGVIAGFFPAAPLGAFRAAIAKAASLLPNHRIRHQAGNWRQAIRILVHFRDGVEQAHGVRMMLRRFINILNRAVLYDVAGIHDGHLITGLGNNAEVVCDQDHTGVEALFQVVHHLQNL